MEHSTFFCRFCLVEQAAEDEPSSSPLISPCNCAGTQAFIHLKCLRKWQENVQARDCTDERAFRCSVCRSLFSVPPPRPRASTRIWQALRGVGGALCITLLAFGLSGPPWPHLALLVLLLLGARSHCLLVLALLLLGSLLAALHARGLRVVMRMDGAGQLGLAVIRHGAPVQGLGPGTLLVASEGLEHTMFRRSVVLLYEHSRAGAKGLILTQGLAMPPAGAAAVADAAPGPSAARRAGAGGPQNNTTAAAAAGGSAGVGPEQGRAPGPGELGVSIRHFLGGPVGMPGEGIRQEVLLVHSVRGVPGACRIPLEPPPAPSHRLGLAAAAATAAAASPSDPGARDRAGGCSAAGQAGSASIAASTVAGSPNSSACAAGAAAAPSLRHALASSPAAAAPGSSVMPAAGADVATADAGPEQGAGAGGGAGGGWEDSPALFVGGALSDVLAKAAAAHAVSGDGKAGASSLVHVYHGMCAWAEGQLEGEIRSGAWRFVPARVGDVLQDGIQPAQAWVALLASGRLLRPRE